VASTFCGPAPDQPQRHADQPAANDPEGNGSDDFYAEIGDVLRGNGLPLIDVDSVHDSGSWCG
jgi:hypothetical protein